MLVDVYCYVCGEYISFKDVPYKRLIPELRKISFCSPLCKKAYKYKHILCVFSPHVNANQKRIDSFVCAVSK